MGNQSSKGKSKVNKDESSSSGETTTGRGTDAEAMARSCAGGGGGCASPQTSQHVQEQVTPSWQSSLAAGLTRSFAYSLKTLGMSGKVLHRMMTKQAFMHIGKRTALHAASAPPLRDVHQAAWQKSHGGKMSWATKVSGESALCF